MIPYSLIRLVFTRLEIIHLSPRRERIKGKFTLFILFFFHYNLDLLPYEMKSAGRNGVGSLRFHSLSPRSTHSSVQYRGGGDIISFRFYQQCGNGQRRNSRVISRSIFFFLNWYWCVFNNTKYSLTGFVVSIINV